MKKTSKGGLSKQQRQQLHHRGQRQPVRRATHAGLEPDLYTALHDIQRPTIQPLTILGRARLQTHIDHTRSRIANLERSLVLAQDMLGLFPEDNEWVRATIVTIMDSLSSALADARQRLVRYEAEEAADSYQLSLQVAYEMQSIEVRSHENWIGRLDRPRPQPLQLPTPTQPRRRRLRERPPNVPSPIPGPSRGRQPLISDLLPRQALDQALDRAAVETPVPEPDQDVVETSVSNEDAQEAAGGRESEDEAEVEPITRCVHHRLHRCGTASELGKLKKALTKTCEKTCGKKRHSVRHLTLCRPPPLTLKANLDGQFRRIQLESKSEDIIQLPDVQIKPLTIQIDANERAAAEEALSTLLRNETVPIVTIEDSDSEEPLEQLDGVFEGHLNTEALGALAENVEFLRRTYPVSVRPRPPVQDSEDDEEDCRGLVLAYRCSGFHIPSPSTPYGHLSYDGQKTHCECSSYFTQGWCDCDPRIPRPLLEDDKQGC